METITTTQVEVSNERTEEIEDAGLSVEIVNLYCEEFGGTASSVNLADIGDAFEGTFDNHKVFAQEFAKGSGLYDFANALWPATCIDWERATSQLMQNHTEIDGYYFALN